MTEAVGLVHQYTLTGNERGTASFVTKFGIGAKRCCHVKGFHQLTHTTT
jgi:hypothetical protein